MREQHALVGDGDHIVVKRACRDGVRRLLHKQAAGRIEPVKARDRAAGLLVLACGNAPPVRP